jgi:hypothetical protein
LTKLGVVAFPYGPAAVRTGLNLPYDLRREEIAGVTRLQTLVKLNNLDDEGVIGLQDWQAYFAMQHTGRRGAWASTDMRARSARERRIA